MSLIIKETDVSCREWVDRSPNPFGNSEMISNILRISCITTIADLKVLHFISVTQIPVHWEPKILSIVPNQTSYGRVQNAWTSFRIPLRAIIGPTAVPTLVSDYRGSNTARTIEELHLDAQMVVPSFLTVCKEIAKRGGGRAHFGTDDRNITKTKASIESKVLRMQAESGCTLAHAISQIDDGVRGTISFPTASRLKEGLAAFVVYAQKNGWEFDCSNLWNNMNDYGGYVDIDVRLEIPLRAGRKVVGELQFHLDDFYDGTTQSLVSRAHKIYEVMRMIPVTGKCDVDLCYEVLNETSRLYFTTALYRAFLNSCGS